MTDPDAVETLEEGNIYFFYRPRVGEEDPHSRDDLQRLYLVLAPRGRDRYRLALVGRKRLPDPGADPGDAEGRAWGLVEAVEREPQRIVARLGPEDYRTRSRGRRHLPAARPAGEGIYRILRHGDHTHLVYALALPERPGEAQAGLHIEAEASYVLSVKDPTRPSPPSGRTGAGRSRAPPARYPQAMQGRFRGRRFAPADPPGLLDYPGAELLLVAAAEDPEAELGVNLDPGQATPGHARVFRELHLERPRQPVEPLFSGEWR